MEEKLKVCHNCGGICLLNWSFCSSCGANVTRQEAHTVKYAFVSQDHKVLEPIANTLEELLRDPDSFMRAFSGFFIVKFFDFNLTAKIAFAPIEVLLQTDKIGVYVPVRHIFSVIPPTQ